MIFITQFYNEVQCYTSNYFLNTKQLYTYKQNK